MDCPRCGARLSRISLDGAESVYCERCRFADVESDHTRASAAGETWDDALSRFRTTDAGEAGGSTDDGDTGVASDSDGEPARRVDDASGGPDGDPADEADHTPDGRAADADADTSGSDPDPDPDRSAGEAEEA